MPEKQRADVAANNVGSIENFEVGSPKLFGMDYRGKGVRPQSQFVRGRRTCPMCGNTHRYHCSITTDGKLALCKFVPSSRQADDGRYIHLLAPDATEMASDIRQAIRRTAMSETPDDSKPDINHCDAVYCSLLESLELSAYHAEHLRVVRGLSDTTITANLYATMPTCESAGNVCAALAQRFDLNGVPGFYRVGKSWQLNVRHQGFLIPCRDTQGRIVACQIRLDAGSPRYVWFSSRGLHSGASSGAPIHFVKPDLTEQTRRAIITEGPLKADVCSELLDCCVIGLPGVASFTAELGQFLMHELPQLREVAVAFDVDWGTKPEVKNALRRLYTSIRVSGLKAQVWSWDAALGKGLDDYLLRRGQHD
jgi:hypothetical protein